MATVLAAGLLSVAAAGCHDAGSPAAMPAAAGAQAAIQPEGLSIPNPYGHGGDPLAINGVPIGTALAGRYYSFQPTASGYRGRQLRYAVQNKPTWASFDASTGLLAGNPGAADVGRYEGIAISVTDGTRTAALPTFSITVEQAASGSVTVSWMPPTTNTNGSVLMNLAGYQIRYGTSATDMTQRIDVSSPGLTSYVVENLTPGAWYFAVEAYNSDGTTSDQSAVVQVNVTGP